MKEFLKVLLSIPIEMLRYKDDSFLPKFFGIFLLFLYSAALCLFIFISYEACNCLFLPLHSCNDAIIVNKCFVSQHWIPAGKTSEFIPDTWFVDVKVNNIGYDWVSIFQNYYDTVTNGTSVTVTYKLGRINHVLSIRDLWGNN